MVILLFSEGIGVLSTEIDIYCNGDAYHPKSV